MSLPSCSCNTPATIKFCSCKDQNQTSTGLAGILGRFGKRRKGLMPIWSDHTPEASHRCDH